MPVLLIIVFLVVFVLVFVLREKRSINKHKKNQSYKSKNVHGTTNTKNDKR